MYGIGRSSDLSLMTMPSQSCSLQWLLPSALILIFYVRALNIRTETDLQQRVLSRTLTGFPFKSPETHLFVMTDAISQTHS